MNVIYSMNPRIQIANTNADTNTMVIMRHLKLVVRERDYSFFWALRLTNRGRSTAGQSEDSVKQLKELVSIVVGHNKR